MRIVDMKGDSIHRKILHNFISNVDNKRKHVLNRNFIIYIHENAFENVVYQNGGHIFDGEMS